MSLYLPDLENIEKVLKNENAVQGATNTPGGQVEQRNQLFHLQYTKSQGGCQE